MRISWADVYALNVVEFLNVLCYLKDKKEHEKKLMEDYKSEHNLK